MIKQAANFAAVCFGFTAPCLVIHMRFYWRKRESHQCVARDSNSPRNVTSKLSKFYLLRGGL